MDEARVMVDKYGSLYSFSSTMFGKMPKSVQHSFDLTEIEKQIKEMLDEDYSAVKDQYDEIVYKDFLFQLTLNEEGKPVLIVTLDVDCNDYVNEYVVSMGERLQLVVF
ncbi:MAG: hypothetical protein II711_04045 [Clostridia bacterium]|nr:hypothetical protein [Clostridia bacterium]